MGLDITWTCDSCRKKCGSVTANEPPNDWFIIKNHNDSFTQAYICDACYAGLFKKRKAA